MVRHPKRRIRQTSKSSSRQLEPATVDSIRRARAAMAMIHVAPFCGSLATAPGNCLAKAVTNPSHEPIGLTATFLERAKSAALRHVHQIRQAAIAPGMARRCKTLGLDLTQSNLPILIFTAVTTLALFETVRLQVTWPDKTQHAAIAASEMIPAPAILQPSSENGASAGAAMTPDIALNVDQNNSEMLGVAPATTEKLAPALPIASAALMVVDTLKAEGASRSAVAPVQRGPTAGDTRSAAPRDHDSLATFPKGLPECMASRSVTARLTPIQVSSLVRAGRQFLANGDVAAARVAFKQAADSCDTDANFLMGTSFDPGILSSSGLKSSIGDVRAARSWYERARNLGSAEASDRLGRLRARS